MNILFVIVASVILGAVPSLQNLVLDNGVTPLALVVVCNAFAGLTGLVWALVRHESLRVSARQLRDLAVIGAVGLFLTDYLLNVAYTFAPVGFVTMIHFTYPSLVCVASAFVFKAGLNKGQRIAIVLSAAGLLLLGCGSEGSVAGFAAALVSAASYTFYMVANEHGSVSETPSSVFVFYSNLFVVAAALVAGATGVTGEELVLPTAGIDWLYAAICGVGFGAALMLLNFGVYYLSAGVASFVNMIEPITSLVVSALVYHYALSATTVLGCALIVGALVFASLKLETRAASSANVPATIQMSA